MIKTMAAILGLVALGVAQGETVESKVSINDLFPINGTGPAEVTHIHLHAGNWVIGGVVNIFELAETGTVFATGGIDYTVGIPQDGTSPVTSQQLDHPTNVMQNVTLPAKLVKIPPGDGLDVYLSVFSNQPGQAPPRAFVWGYISATLR